MNRNTGHALTGWPHVEQSLGVLFTTPKGQRVMRRHFGSDVPRLVDSAVAPYTVIRFFAAIAEAVRLYEPRFRVTRMKLVDATTAGQITISVEGVYFPRGHLGDFSISEPQAARFAVQ